MKNIFFTLIFIVYKCSIFSSNIKLGVDVFFEKELYKEYKDKKIGLITNHTGVDKNLKRTIDKFLEHKNIFSIKAIFSPEHGLFGNCQAGKEIKNSKYKNIIVYSLHGKNKRPSAEMLKDIDLLIYDIQDIGSRSYTYTSTLFFCMEEAAKKNIKVIVLDRPNPLGDIIDGPMLEKKYRSFLGYINIPYCHGMTIGELSKFFNEEYKIGCKLKVITMEGWNRKMHFNDTGLLWIPPSPHMPEADSVFYYPSTGILGELKIVNIGVGYTLPFKIVGAPWIDADLFSEKLNKQNLPGVLFIPFHFRPFYGLYKKEECHGIKIMITDKTKYNPISVQYMILGMVKSLYPKIFLKKINFYKERKNIFCKVNGTDKIYNILIQEPFPAWSIIKLQKEQNKNFFNIRKKYLFEEYSKK
ncbi:MAG: hypothetical protein AMS24_05090 [Chlamydiae bacterium SM23_39]|nr:MAG: hypothetical protein AMS24_05090 [Chlamydiae bacterium SM23_39]